jgi:integrating conjugative element membrane protein (TIGR03747 family)
MRPTNIINGIVLWFVNTILIALLSWIVLLSGLFFEQLLFKNSVLEQHAVQAMQSTIHYTESFYFVNDWIEGAVQSITANFHSLSSIHTEPQGLVAFLSPWTGSLNTGLALYAGSYVAMTIFVVVKAMVFMSFFPLFELMVMLALCEGLIARSLRRYHGERESALLYHQSKKFAMLSFYCGEFIFLVMPLSINPAIFFIVYLSVVGVFIALAIKQFKKYL